MSNALLRSQMVAIWAAALALSCSAELVVVAESGDSPGVGGTGGGGNEGFGGAGSGGVGSGAAGGTSIGGAGGFGADGSGQGGSQAGAAQAGGTGAGGAGAGGASTGGSSAFGGAGAGGSAAAGNLCDTNNGCAGGSFCEFDDCAASTGRCVQLGSNCDDTRDPSCGCSGITYWNDCLRTSAGETQASAGACPAPVAQTCGGAADARCGDGASVCVVSASCGTNLDGTCWELPCPQVDNGLRYSSCDGSLNCVDACSALVGPLVRVLEDATCP